MMRTRIAPPDRVSILLERLRDPTQFGWGGIGLTTIARGDPAFKVATGVKGIATHRKSPD